MLGTRDGDFYKLDILVKQKCSSTLGYPAQCAPWRDVVHFDYVGLNAEFVSREPYQGNSSDYRSDNPMSIKY